jgi:hypothetical protein
MHVADDGITDEESVEHEQTGDRAGLGAGHPRSLRGTLGSQHERLARGCALGRGQRITQLGPCVKKLDELLVLHSHCRAMPLGRV